MSICVHSWFINKLQHLRLLIENHAFIKFDLIQICVEKFAHVLFEKVHVFAIFRTFTEDADLNWLAACDLICELGREI